jgi:hypothetical protein
LRFYLKDTAQHRSKVSILLHPFLPSSFRDLNPPSGALQSKEDKESSVTSGDNQEPHSSTRNPEDRISVAQADDKLREKLESLSGEGGVAGIEYENGKPVAMKRSVRENMFRLI